MADTSVSVLHDEEAAFITRHSGEVRRGINRAPLEYGRYASYHRPLWFTAKYPASYHKELT